jgi:2-polyprenyl-3-methyl-5-hydroxy-6-metoxy-1,4-benzoquinol methylase
LSEGGWKPKRSLDRESRVRKAHKIATILARRTSLDGATVIESGTGAGVIPAALAEVVGSSGRVVSVDVADYRTVTDGFEFHLVSGVDLPFTDGSPDGGFDVAVSNHVIEHVGDASAQQHHVQELVRVLRPGGIGYLATPNRNFPIEPHFKVPFLAWLPTRWQAPYLRLTRRGSVYDCRLLRRAETLRMFDRAGVEVTDVTEEALAVAAHDERSRAARLMLALPAPVRRRFWPLVPTWVFVFRKAVDANDGVRRAGSGQ